MSDYDDERPSKRRRRDSVSATPPRRRDREEPSGRHYRDRSPRPIDRRRKPSRDRDYKPQRRSAEKSVSPDRDIADNNNSRRKHRSRSRSRSRQPSRDREQPRHRHRNRSRSASPRSDRHRRRDRDQRRDRDRGDKQLTRRSPSPQPYKRSKNPLPSQNDAFTSTSNPNSSLDKPVEKQKPNFGLTGKLAAASNTIQTANQTIVLKYHEPADARKPPARDKWRLYVFKNDEILDMVELSEQSCWLIGREVAVADFPIEHASCSKQHAVIQFRYQEKRNEFGDKIGKVKPYIIDLESANGTSLNDELIPAAKYVELRDKDMLKFGHSSREYVIQLPK